MKLRAASFIAVLATALVVFYFGALAGAPSFAGAINSGRAGRLAVGRPCHGYGRRDIGPDGPQNLCLGVKIIAFTDPHSGASTLSPSTADDDLRRVNSIWAQCGISFQVDQYQSVDPTAEKLQFAIANNEDLTEIRSSFGSDDSLLIVSTGRWNRTGSLGKSPANAWTAMPGSAPYGAILEQPVVTAPNMIAHELGHYLNLNHVSDATDLMNPVIYSTSATLTANQCNEARGSVARYWTKMLR